MISQIISSFGQLNATVQGALIAAFVGMLSVGLTVLSNALTARYQFKHQRKMREAEMLHEFRKEVFLDAAQSLHESIRRVSLMQDFDLSLTSVTTEVTNSLAGFSKLHIVAPPEIISSISAFTTAINQALLKLIPGRLEVSIKNNERSRSQQEMNSSLEVLQLKTDELKALVDAKREYHEIVAKQSEWEEISRQLKDHQATFEKSVSEFSEASSNYSLVCIQKVKEITPLAFRACAKIRIAIGVDATDEDYLSAVTNEMLDPEAEFSASVKSIRDVFTVKSRRLG